MKRPFHPLRTSVVLLLGFCLALPWAQAGPAAETDARRIHPADLVYVGAFRLPGASGGSSWEWGGDALTYYAEGDPNGPDDGLPGSLFGIGHDHHQYVSEIGIPKPVISQAKNVEELPTAKTLQPFQNIRGDLFKDYEIYRSGLAYLPPQGEQPTGKLYFCWGQHMQEHATGPSHGWCELDLAKPRMAGPWRVGDFENYATCDYLFDIPQAWADANTPGMLLATGRFRDGGQGGKGPSIIAIGPAGEGNPPPPGTKLKATPLLLYSTAYDEENHPMNGYHEADEWSGGAWLTSGSRSAVVFVGTKGLGKYWYGFAEGTVWPDEPPFPPIPPPPNDDRGWWSTGFEGQMVFYDPADLAAVAQGRMKPYEPQSYATLRIDERLFNVKGPQQKYHVRACAFDRARGLLFVLEPWADNEKPIVHVWKVPPTP